MSPQHALSGPEIGTLGKKNILLGPNPSKAYILDISFLGKTRKNVLCRNMLFGKKNIYEAHDNEVLL